MPFAGFIMAHSNEAEWLKFRNNKDNEALFERAPYQLQVKKEVATYDKLPAAFEFSGAPCATLCKIKDMSLEPVRIDRTSSAARSAREDLLR